MTTKDLNFICAVIKTDKIKTTKLFDNRSELNCEKKCKGKPCKFILQYLN